MECGQKRGERATLSAIAEKDEESAVGIKLTVHGIRNIDQVAGTFCVDVTLHMWWLESKLKLRCAELKADVVPISSDACLVPHFHFENSVEPVQFDEPETIELRKNFPPGIVHWERRMRCVLTERFELADFPFDVQVLSIVIRSNSKADLERRRYFVLLQPEPDSAKKESAVGVELKPRVALTEWFIYSPNAEAGHDTKDKPVFRAHLVVRRKHFYYSFNVIGMMGAITTLGFTTAAQPPAEFADRCTVTLTLLLTAVAFKLVIADSLPKVAYVTKLDAYISFGFVLLLVLMVENAAVATVQNESLRESFDSAFYTALISVWSIVHLIMCMVICHHVVRCKQHLGEPHLDNSSNAVHVAQTLRMLSLPWRGPGAGGAGDFQTLEA
jgi:hypothetical protein